MQGSERFQVEYEGESVNIFGNKEIFLDTQQSTVVSYDYVVDGYVGLIELPCALCSIVQDKIGNTPIVINLAICGFLLAKEEAENRTLIPTAFIKREMRFCKLSNVVFNIVKKSESKANQSPPPELSQELNRVMTDIIEKFDEKRQFLLSNQGKESKQSSGFSRIVANLSATAKAHRLRSILGVLASVAVSLGAFSYYANLQAALSAAVVSSFAWPLVAIVLVGSVVALGLGWGLSKLVSSTVRPGKRLKPLALRWSSIRAHAKRFFQYLGNVARVVLMNAGAVGTTIALLTALFMLPVTLLAAPPLVAFVPALLVLGAIAPKLIGETLQLVGGVIRFVAAHLATLLVHLQVWVMTKAKVMKCEKDDYYYLEANARIGQKVVVGISAFFYAIGSIIPGILWAISLLIDKGGELLASKKAPNVSGVEVDPYIFAEKSRFFMRDAMDRHQKLSIYDPVPVEAIEDATLLKMFGAIGQALSLPAPGDSI